jgi:hypothetical protein
MIVGMKPPKPTVISVATEDDFAMAHYTTEWGKSFEIHWITWNEIYCSQTTPVETFSWKNLTGHIEKLQAHQVILDHERRRQPFR